MSCGLNTLRGRLFRLEDRLSDWLEALVASRKEAQERLAEFQKRVEALEKGIEELKSIPLPEPPPKPPFQLI